MKKDKEKSEGMSRRDFLKVAGVAAGAAGVLAQSNVASAAAKGDSGSGASASGKQRKYMRSVMPINASRVRRELQEFIDEIQLIDTHEHLKPEAYAIEHAKNVLDFSLVASHYASNDMESAGLTKVDKNEIFGPDVPLSRKWALFEPYWEKMKNTGYGWSVQLVTRGYYGLNGLNSKTYEELSQKVADEYKPGLHKRVFDAAGIEHAIVDVNVEDVDRKLFSPVLRVHDYTDISKPEDINKFSKIINSEVTTTKGITEAMQKLISDWKKRGIIAAKTAMAYKRTLQVNPVTENDAQRGLDLLLYRKDASGVKQVQDFVFHQVMKACSDQHFPIQIHTGILNNNNYGPIERTNPMHLCDVLARYPQAKVDLFHAGYPWTREVGTMGKTYTCMYADLCWTHIISPIAAKMAIHEWLDAMPASKILAFGGDYQVAECCYGHSVIARTNVGEALTERVENGRMSMDEAKRTAQMILRDNA